MLGTFEGRVIVNFGRHMTVETADGECIECRIKGRQLRPVCGDQVEGDYLADGSGRIRIIRERHSLMLRHDPHLGRQALAANVDQLIVTCAVKPALDPALLDRYLAAAELLNIPALIVFNKLDLASTADMAQFDVSLNEFSALGYPVLRTSTRDGTGMKALATLLHQRTGVIIGQSGVGKSSLLNTLVPEAGIRIGEISAATEEGRHTTTVAALYHLPEGGNLIDSPGVRGFQLWPMQARELAQGFREFHGQAGNCKFSDCTHLHEPHCRIRAAVEAGSISRRRYESYQVLCEQLNK